jgi:hypothetical protein
MNNRDAEPDVFDEVGEVAQILDIPYDVVVTAALKWFLTQPVSVMAGVLDAFDETDTDDETMGDATA